MFKDLIFKKLNGNGLFKLKIQNGGLKIALFKFQKERVAKKQKKEREKFDCVRRPVIVDYLNSIEVKKTADVQRCDFICQLCFSVKMAKITQIDLKEGSIFGGYEVSCGAEYFYFKGIPYAKPPVGKLRFQVKLYL